MKNTIQKSINVISGLVQKYIVIKNKMNENALNQQNYQQLENRLNNLEKMFSDNNNNNNNNGDSSAPYIEASVDVQQINATMVPIVVHYQAAVKNAPDGAKPTVQAYDVDYDIILDGGELNTSEQTFTFSENMWFPGSNVSGTIRLIFTYEGAETVNIDISYSFSFPEIQIIVESPITITGTVGTEIEPRELNVTINSPDGYFNAFPTGNLPSGIDFVDNKIIGIPQNVESGSFEITVYDPTQTTSKTIVVNYTFAAATAESDGKAYIYTVSGADRTDANGNYCATGEYADSVPVYTNGSCVIRYWMERGCWTLNLSSTTDTELYASNNVYITGEWSSTNASGSAPIVTAYAGNNQVERDDYVYTISGAGAVVTNGNYYDTGEIHDGHPVYTNGLCYLYYKSSVNEWKIADGIDSTYQYYYIYADFWNNGNTTYVNPGNGGWTPLPTIAPYAG